MDTNTSQHTQADAHGQKPEWLRLPAAVRLFGISRSALYELIASGHIKSTCLRKRGAVRGIRLISYDSLAAYIEASAAKQSAHNTIAEN